MIKAIDVRAELAGLPILDGRAETTEAEAAAAFAELAPFRDGAVFAGSFSGDSPWERHAKGDELVQVLAGDTTLTILTDQGREILELREGMIAVVPRGHWHRFHARDGVTVMTATPLPTDHSFADDPR
ncbi:MAG: cupin domain-containing protein [Alphaproteobacteria bacterium]|jgi:mannose-6-phosphate isomerase-like protein (cupin superfamily)|nr:cupin domain-containing protein [Alphaproteobacteria bacterium]MDP6815387.1 cupin domain-containing protein [Alphaproteobacteria bacterium]